MPLQHRDIVFLDAKAKRVAVPEGLLAKGDTVVNDGADDFTDGLTHYHAVEEGRASNSERGVDITDGHVYNLLVDTVVADYTVRSTE